MKPEPLKDKEATFTTTEVRLMLRKQGLNYEKKKKRQLEGFTKELKANIFMFRYKRDALTFIHTLEKKWFEDLKEK